MTLKEYVEKLSLLLPKYADNTVYHNGGGEYPCMEVEDDPEVGWIDEENDFEFVDQRSLKKLKKDGDVPADVEADAVLVA